MEDINTGNVLLTIIGFLVVYVLNDIKGEISEMKTLVKGLESDLRGGLTMLERRVTRIESRCEVKHDDS